jgi:hypothetical protein
MIRVKPNLYRGTVPERRNQCMMRLVVVCCHEVTLFFTTPDQQLFAGQKTGLPSKKGQDFSRPFSVVETTLVLGACAPVTSLDILSHALVGAGANDFFISHFQDCDSVFQFLNFGFNDPRGVA